MSVESRGRNEEATVKPGTVGGDRIGLARGVRTPAEPVASATIRVAPDNDRLAIDGSPLALNAKECCARLEDQVVALAVGE